MGERPNILFIFTDQQRSDWLAPNPDIPVRSPNLERLAARGVRFTRAVCPSPLCAPTRACLASGKEYERCGVLDNDILYDVDGNERDNVAAGHPEIVQRLAPLLEETSS